jgi:hypothetical protein
MTRIRATAGIALMGLTILASLSALASAQTAPLLYACVDPQGRLTMIAPPPAGTCGPKERLISWPAAPTPGPGTAFYTREGRITLTPGLGGFFGGAVVICDEPGDVAVSGGWRFDIFTPPLPPAGETMVSSWSCAASGWTCHGGRGEDGWEFIARAAEVRSLTVVVTCATAAN